MTTYKERQQEKLERYLDLAEKAERKSEEHYNTAHRIADTIEPGQPILTGHHSESRHRKDIQRIIDNDRKSIEEEKKAEYYRNKANHIVNPISISSDDPEAIEKLEKQLSQIEEQREKMKAVNKEARKLKQPSPYQHYEVPYLSQNIKRVKDRIQHLKHIKEIKDEETTVNAVTLIISQEENRVKLIFPSKPPEEVRSQLKRHGFRWSPRSGAWQAMTNDYSIYIAREIQSNYI
ncbi:MAG: DUF3560 domain-containing protein [Theionarchaea archaeon]|nr:DUF3560 domain-containing protein [Theionarchaea archaeon]DBA34823.1 TPA_asm: hypothetical protein vir521_00029 [Caudoviricetes sp. vir521]